MNKKMILGLIATTLFSGLVQASDMKTICALNVTNKADNFSSQCEAGEIQLLNGGAAFGGFGTSIAIKIGENATVHGMAFLTRGDTLEHNIQLIKNNTSEAEAASLLTNKDSMTQLENGQMRAYLKCTSTKKDIESAKKDLCSIM